MSKVITNSFWGIISNILQNLFYSIFFIIVARKYSSIDFSNYILANTLYGFILAFSTLGLGQWFIRSIKSENEVAPLIYTFFKLQIIIGLCFYFLNIVIALFLYDSVILHQLVYLVGINIILDNIIYVIKYVNISFHEQKRTFIITTIESLIKLIFGIIILYVNVSIIVMVTFLVIFRFLSLQIFLNKGSIIKFNLLNVLKATSDFKVIQKIVISNWPFLIISSVSVIYWKVGNILLSKMLPLINVAVYEISFKIFAIAEALPVIVSSTIFPVLIDKIENNFNDTVVYFKNLYFIFTIYGILSFSFIYCFSGDILPLIFGNKYPNIISNTIQMFATMLIFPTALLQANFIIALKYEKIDMTLNLISLMCHVLISYIGIYYFKSISILNISTFVSFLIFHILQDVFFIKKKIMSLKSILNHYFYFISAIVLFYVINQFYSGVYLFVIFWFIVLLVIISLILKNQKFKYLKSYIKLG